MHLTLDISAETAARLTTVARTRSESVAMVAGRLLDQAAMVEAARKHREPPSADEIHEWLESLAQFSDQLNIPEGETFSRERIYQDHP